MYNTNIEKEYLRNNLVVIKPNEETIGGIVRQYPFVGLRFSDDIVGFFSKTIFGDISIRYDTKWSTIDNMIGVVREPETAYAFVKNPIPIDVVYFAEDFVR